ncbi:TIGR02270 family protein [Comamonas sp. JC664]|uniref:TIGR02270 family protein n=1 Tax=Comamonas sp. JC664 TaxID=2801917 RepID=UPI001749D0A7|nr:TIGR02270 family protein [Comamonas sp. JC664]
MPMLRMDVFEEHFSEAAFLYSQWERALRGAHYNLEETARLEGRLLAHLDGLVLGGESTTEALLRSALEGNEPAEVFCAVFASVAESPHVALEAVLALMPAASPGVQASLRRALELSGCRGLEAALVPLLKSSEVSVQTLALEVLAFRGAVPREAALELLGHSDDRVVVAAMRGLGALGKDIGRRDLPRLLTDNRANVRLAAIEHGLMAGVRAAWDACGQEAKGDGDCAAAARMLQAIFGDDKVVERLVDLSADNGIREGALWALGFTGRGAAAEACLELMGQAPSVARLAGEAFSAITGLMLKDAFSKEIEEEESLPPLEEDDLDADLTPRHVDGLPVPARDAVADWWLRVRQDYSRSERYLGGTVFSGSALLNALAKGPMRRRHVHAQELALRTQGTHVVQTLAFTGRQIAESAGAARVSGTLSARPMARTFGG